MNDKPKLIDVQQMSLEVWLNIVFNPPNETLFIDWEFPTQQHSQEYLETINKRSEDEVYRLLRRFLIPSTTFPTHDTMRLWELKAMKTDKPEVFERLIRRGYVQRLILYAAKKSQSPPWEGITWILDLLPHFPKQALEALYAYILAHAQELPDGRYSGLHDAAAIIRAKFIGMPGTQSEMLKTLRDVHWRDFECLVERLYHKIGYETQLTPPQKDKGRDVIATRKEPAKLEKLLIECKHYLDEPVGLGIVQRLLGVVSGEKVNKGVIATTSYFTRPAINYAKENPRIELINGEQLILLMNEHLGPSWPLHIERLISESQKNTIQ